MFNKEHYQVTDRNILLRNIRGLVICTVLLIMLVLNIAGSIWFCYECDFNIKEISFAFPIIICLVQIISMYISITRNNRKITEMIDQLQLITEKRNIFYFNVPFLEISSILQVFNFFFAAIFKKGQKITEKSKPNIHSSPRYPSTQS